MWVTQGQIIMMESDWTKVAMPWENIYLTTCTYNNSQMMKVNISVLGMHTLHENNSIFLNVQPYFYNFILSFSLVTKNWTPMNNFLKIAITDERQNLIQYQVIDLKKQVDQDHIYHQLQCNNHNFSIERYEIQSILNPEESKRIKISFEGEADSRTEWGITSAKLVVGCSNMLQYDGVDCQKCADGYYPVKSPYQSISRCKTCALQCKTCIDAFTCTSCEAGFELYNGNCINNFSLHVITVPVSNPLICSNHTFLISKTIDQEQQLKIILTDLPSHRNKTRIQFYFAYVPSEFQNQDRVIVQIDQLNKIEILGTSLNLYKMKPKQKCQGFGTEGYFSLYKVTSQYFDHNSSTLKIVLSVNRPRKIGLYQVGFEYLVEEALVSNLRKTLLYQIQNDITVQQRMLIDDNQNITNETNSTTNPKDQMMMKTIQQIQEVSHHITTQIKQDTRLSIVIHYPIKIEVFPYITANLSKESLTVIPQVAQQSSSYQLLIFNLNQSLLNSSIDLFMHETVPQNSAVRRLQAANPGYLMTTILLTRYDYLSSPQLASSQKFAIYFEAMSWIGIGSTIILSIFSNGIIVQKYTLLLQIILFHLYIYTQYLPINFKIVIGGLRRMQNFNYFSISASQAIQQLLLGNVVQYSPTKFTMFTKDVNFTRAIYPSIIIIFIYFIIFILLNIIRKLIETNVKLYEAQQRISLLNKIKLFICSTSQRFNNYWFQIWQYLYLTFVFSELAQLYNLSYPIDSNRSAIPNNIFSFSCLLLAIALPIITFILLHNNYQTMSYFAYAYWYQNICFQKLPIHSFPSNHHRVLILVSNTRYFLLTICFVFLGNYPVQCLIAIILIHVFNFGYLKISFVQIQSINSKFNILQYGLFLLLAIGILIAYLTSTYFNTYGYMILGNVLSVICLLLTLLGLVRIGYNIYYKTQQRKIQKIMGEFKPAIGTERIV